MAQAVLDQAGFRIGDIGGDDDLVTALMALEDGQTRELIVDNVRGWWKRAGGWSTDHAFMAPTERVREAYPADMRFSGRAIVRVPEDAMDADAFFKALPPYGKSSPATRLEAARKLLAIAKMGWRSQGRFGARDELYDR